MTIILLIIVVFIIIRNKKKRDAEKRQQELKRVFTKQANPTKVPKLVTPVKQPAKRIPTPTTTKIEPQAPIAPAKVTPTITTVDDDDFDFFEDEVSTPRLPEPIRFYFPTDYVVLDIETEGFDIETDAIIQIAAVRYVNHQATDQVFNQFNADATVSTWLADHSDITQAQVDAGIPLADLINQFSQFIQPDDVLVGHKIGFDLDFLRYNFHKLGCGDIANEYVDTMGIGKYYANRKMVRHSVEQYINDFPAINAANRIQHNALNDILIEHEIFTLERELLGADWEGTIPTRFKWALPKYRINGYPKYDTAGEIIGIDLDAYQDESYQTDNITILNASETATAQYTVGPIPNNEPLKYYLPTDYVMLEVQAEGSQANMPIIQVAALRVQNNQIIDQLSAFNQEAIVAAKMLRDTNITQAQVAAEGISIVQIAEQLRTFIKPDDVLVGHYIGTTISQLRYLFHRLEMGNLDNSYVNTFLIGKYHTNASANMYGSNLAAYFETFGSSDENHVSIGTAADDVYINKQVIDVQRGQLGQDWVGQHYIEADWGVANYGIEPSYDRSMAVRQVTAADRLAIDHKDYLNSNKVLDGLLAAGITDMNRLYKRKAMNLKQLGATEALQATLLTWQANVEKIGKTDQQWIAKHQK